MSADVQKRIALALLSLTLSSLVFVGLYESYRSRIYDQWKADFVDRGDWYGKLTVASQNETLMWEYRPHGRYGNLLTNGFGYRDEDYATPDKPEGVYRVAFVGDSATLGFGADYEDIFVRRFERWARQARPELDLQALNFGVDGYNTLQIEELLKRRVLAWDPDQVVYVMCLNDFDFEDAAAGKIRYFRKPRSFLLMKLTNAYRRITNLGYYDYHYGRNHDAVYAAIESMKERLDRQGIEFHVALLPTFAMSQPDFDAYPDAEIHERVLGFLAENGIPSIDLRSGFQRENGPPRRYAQDVWHPNALGHQVIAGQLRGLVDPSLEPGRRP